MHANMEKEIKWMSEWMKTENIVYHSNHQSNSDHVDHCLKKHIKLDLILDLIQCKKSIHHYTVWYIISSLVVDYYCLQQRFVSIIYAFLDIDSIELQYYILYFIHHIHGKFIESQLSIIIDIITDFLEINQSSMIYQFFSLAFLFWSA